jgi:hypothetical protein
VIAKRIKDSIQSKNQQSKEVVQMTNICPICQKDDAVQRIETLVASGQSSGTFSGPSGGVAYSDGKWGGVGGYTTLSGSSTSNLAKLLEPPSLPPKPKGFGWWWILIVPYGIPIIGAVFFSPFLLVAYVAAGLTGGVYPHGLNVNPLFMIIISIGEIIAGWLAIRFFIIRQRKKKATMQQKIDEAMPRWKIAMQRWEHLYYCHRDGIVYDPETGDTCAPGLVKDFVYK